MSIEQGRITNVVIDDSGTQLTAAAGIGATTLLVEDAYPFNADGGILELNGVSHAYSAADYELKQVTVSPLTVAGAEEDQVYIIPRGSVKVAMVILDDGDEGVRAIVPFGMADAIPDGIRDYNEQEEVFISDETGRWEVKSLDEEVPVVDGSYIDPDTLPDPGGPTEPPAVSPAITVTGTAESFIIEAESVEPSTEIVYEVSEDFNPDTLSGTWTPLAGVPTKSTVYVLASPPSGGVFLQDKVYGFRATATNGVPPDPAPSAAVGASLDPTVLNEIITAKLVAGFILGETIQVGAITINADDGIRIPQPNGKWVHFPSDGTPATITAALFATALTISGNSFVYDLMQVFAKIVMVSGITNPTESPTITTFHPFIQTNVLSPGSVTGLFDAGTYWGVLRSARVVFIDKTTYLDTGLSVDLTGHPAGSTTKGGTMLGGKYYILVQYNVPFLRHQILRFSSTGAYEALIQANVPSVVNAEFPALGHDGTNLLVAWGNPWTIRTYNPSTGAQVGSDVTTNQTGAKNLYYVDKGTFDFGGTRYVVAAEDLSVRVFNTSGVRQTSQEFARAGGGIVRGMAWEPTPGRFIMFSETANLYFHARTPADGTVHASYAWCDDDGSPTTADSPDESLSVGARKWVRIEGQPAPDASVPGTDKAERVAIYASESGAANLRLQGILPLDQTIFEMDLIDLAGALAPSVNGFAAIAAPGTIESAVSTTIDAVSQPLIRLAGDGVFGLLGSNQWDSGEISATGSWAGFVRFSRVGKLVTAVGYVDRNTDFGTTQTTVAGFTIPTWARPVTNKAGTPYPGYNDVDTYRYQWNADGTVTIQRTGVITTFMKFNESYYVDN